MCASNQCCSGFSSSVPTTDGDHDINSLSLSVPRLAALELELPSVPTFVSLSLIASRDSLSVADPIKVSLSPITVPPHDSHRCCLHSATIVTNTCYAIGKSTSTASFVVDLETVLESICYHLTTNCLVAYIS